MYKTRLHRFNCSTKIQTLNALPCRVSILNNPKHIVQIHNIALLKSCEAVPLRYFAKTNTTHCLKLLKSCEAVLLCHFVLSCWVLLCTGSLITIIIICNIYILRIFYKNNQMRITNITINTKVRTYLQSLWNQRRKLHHLQLVIRKLICRKSI